MFVYTNRVTRRCRMSYIRVDNTYYIIHSILYSVYTRKASEIENFSNRRPDDITLKVQKRK